MDTPESGSSNIMYNISKVPAKTPVNRAVRSKLLEYNTVSNSINEMNTSAANAAATPAIPGCVCTKFTSGAPANAGNNSFSRTIAAAPPTN